MSNKSQDSFLGVSRSVSGRRWQSRLIDARAALTHSQRLALPEIVGRVIAARGVGHDAGEQFLNPTIRDLLPDPFHLIDMERTADRLTGAIMAGEQLAVFGDYDVDGATSSALLTRFIEAAGGNVIVYIPDRMREGYGPNAPALLKLREEGAQVVVTVDCGTASYDALAVAADAVGARAAGVPLARRLPPAAAGARRRLGARLAPPRRRRARSALRARRALHAVLRARRAAKRAAHEPRAEQHFAPRAVPRGLGAMQCRAQRTAL